MSTLDKGHVRCTRRITYRHLHDAQCYQTNVESCHTIWWRVFRVGSKHEQSLCSCTVFNHCVFILKFGSMASKHIYILKHVLSLNKTFNVIIPLGSTHHEHCDVMSVTCENKTSEVVPSACSIFGNITHFGVEFFAL